MARGTGVRIGLLFGVERKVDKTEKKLRYKIIIDLIGAVSGM